MMTANGGGGNNLEVLINQLHQYDARDSVIFRTLDGRQQVPPSIDISLTSSHGMSSFLQDFDLNTGSHRKRPFEVVIGAGIDEGLLDDCDMGVEDFCMVVENTPLKQVLVTAGSRQSMHDSKPASTKTLHHNNGGSRQSLQSSKNAANNELMRGTPSSNGAASNSGANQMIVANGKNTANKNSVHSKKGSIKQGQVM
jgi:hypothetical protein